MVKKKNESHQLLVSDPNKYRNNRETVLEAVKNDGMALAYASADLKNDREVVLAAVKQDERALLHASSTLRNDRSFIFAAVKQHGRALEHAPDDLKNDREIVLLAIKQNGWALQCASDNLKRDREIVLEAVKRNGWALEHVAEDLKNDREIVLAAVNHNGWALAYASLDRKNDKEIVRAAVKQDVRALLHASPDLKNDRDIVLVAVKHDGWRLRDASDEIKKDREIVLQAVKQKGRAIDFSYASVDLKNDREIVLAAVKQDGSALLCASDDLKKDREIVLEAVKEVVRTLSDSSGLSGTWRGLSRLLRKYAFLLETQTNDKEIALLILWLHHFLTFQHFHISWSIKKDQFKILRTETKFNLLEKNAVFQDFQRETLHCAAERGFASIIEFILAKGQEDVAHSTLANDSKGNRPLHRAAKQGHLKACMILLEMGGGVKRNKDRKFPLDLATSTLKAKRKGLDCAKKNEYSKVIDLLVSSNNMIKNGIIGRLAIKEAIKDKRHITAVSWHVCPLDRWTRFIGACHSVLDVTVGEVGAISTVKANTERYFVQNVSAHENIRITLWKERSYLEHDFKTIATAGSPDIRDNLRMSDLYEQAKMSGEYDIVKKNCHHMARDLYNFCLKETSSHKRLRKIPNRIHARLAKKFGTDGSTISQVRAPLGVKLRSTIPDSQVSTDTEPFLDIETNCHSFDHNRGALTAKLSFWIYEEETNGAELPFNGLETVEWVRQDNQNAVTWAIVKSHDTVYVVFKGTKTLTDKIIDVMALVSNSQCDNERPLGVHAGMWGALHVHGVMTTETIHSKLESILELNPDLNIVLCGHSLGGGLAILCGLELLDKGREIAAVVGHGAPQVVKPDSSSLLWKRLNEITTVYINGFDVVPRLPSCFHDWKDTMLDAVAAETKKKTGSVESRLEDLVENSGVWEALEKMKYHRHLGKLFFMTKIGGDIKCMMVDAVDINEADGDGYGWETLRKTPVRSGRFIVDHHSEYPKMIESLLEEK